MEYGPKTETRRILNNDLLVLEKRFYRHLEPFKAHWLRDAPPV
jgi:hypothetical protein